MKIQIALVLAVLFTFATSAEDKPKVSSLIEVCQKTTLIDLEAKGKPALEIIGEIAKKMGYEKVIDKDKIAENLKYSCNFKQKPAFECLTEICDNLNLVYGGAGIGEDFALGIYKPGKWKSYVRPSGGFAAVFAQASEGTSLGDPFHKPFSLRIRVEPDISCSFKDVSVIEQMNAAGKPCDLIGLQAVPFGVQEVPGKDKTDPWPGLSSFAVKATAEVAKKKLVATVCGLTSAISGFSVQHESKELFTIVRVADAGHLLVVETSIESASKARGVVQGGWGNPVGPQVEAAIGAQMDFADGKGVPQSPVVISWEGDGTHSRVSFKFPKAKLDAAGGIAGLTLKFSKILEKEEVPLEFQFKNFEKKF